MIQHIHLSLFFSSAKLVVWKNKLKITLQALKRSLKGSIFFRDWIHQILFFFFFFKEYHFKIPSIINYTHSLFVFCFFFYHFCSFRSQHRVTEAPRLVLTRCPTSVLFRKLCSFCVEECDSRVIASHSDQCVWLGAMLTRARCAGCACVCWYPVSSPSKPSNKAALRRG